MSEFEEPSMEETKFEVEAYAGVQDKRVYIIRINGNLDYIATPNLEHILHKLLKEQAVNLVFDLSKVDYVSSAGWGTFVGFLKEIKLGGGDLRIAALSSYLKNIFDLLKIDSFIIYHQSVDEAVEALRA